ncbi:UPF0158 family protein [Aquabacterium sp.]|uniref:UPF0158 family protein n=1 Tax=Aquabacterium sp. TaxID=1872578 RepID=UPI003D6D5CA4
MKTLSIDLDDLIMALSTRYELDDPSHYLDLEQGEVIYAGEGLEGLPADLATNPQRYAWIEAVEAEPALHIMEAFIAQLADEGDRASLTAAFEDNEPFEAFTEALADLSHLRGTWFSFQLAAYTELARQWCQDHGIEPQWR